MNYFTLKGEVINLFLEKTLTNLFGVGWKLVVGIGNLSFYLNEVIRN
jgi:hypothetical protein